MRDTQKEILETLQAILEELRISNGKDEKAQFSRIMNELVVCSDCGGTGLVNKVHICYYCKGHGKIQYGYTSSGSAYGQAWRDKQKAKSRE